MTRRWCAQMTWALICTLSLTAHASTASYYYDELGRLIETVAADGSSVFYAYDAVGNITSVRHNSTAATGISGFSPISGPVGTSVTIFGSGFNVAPASNTVKFNGTAATVISATATSLVVAVPSGASTGAISVTNGANTATSATSFTVASLGAPTLTSFTPTIGSQGTAVTLNGTNFQANSATDKVLFGTIAAPVSGVTAVSIATSVPSPAASGKISVTTPYGSVTSAADFFAVPTGFNVADVQFTGRVTLGGAAITASTTASGKIALVLFDGVGAKTGNYLQLTSVAPAGGTLSVFSPDGSLLTTGSVSNALIGLPRLPMSGTYTIVVAPSAAATFSLAVEPATVVNVDGQAAAISSVGTGYGAFATFDAYAGQNLGLVLNGIAFSGGGSGHLNLNIVRPDLSNWAQSTNCVTSNPGAACSAALTSLPLSGTYLIQVTNPGYPAITGGAFTLSTDKTGTLTSGVASQLTLRTGQNGRLSFSGTAGQAATIRFQSIVTTPANQSVYVSILKPDGTALTGLVSGSPSTNGNLINLSNLPSTGTYTMIVLPGYGAATTMSVALNPVSELQVDGPAVNITSAASGYGTSLTFTGTAGQNLALMLNGLAFSGGASGTVSLNVVRPDGTSWVQATNCSTGNPGAACSTALTNLPLTGTYLIQVANSSYPAITGGAFTLSSDKTGTLTSGSASLLTLHAGQNGRLTFAGTAGQSATIRFQGITTTPVNLPVWAAILKPDGSTAYGAISGSTSTNGNVFYIASLPSTGTYTLIVGPSYGAATTMSVALNPVSELQVDGPAVNITSAASGYGTSLTFTGTAGQNLALMLNGLAFSGGASGTVSLNVVRPDGTSWIQATNCSTGNPGAACSTALTNLPLTGTYLIQVANSGFPAITGGAFTLSSDKTGTLTSGSASQLTLHAGQNGRLTFAGTAGQPATIRFQGIATTPVNLTVWAAILKPDGSTAYGAISGTTSTNGNVFYIASLPVTGTYTLIVGPSYGAATTMSVALNPVSDLQVDGPAVNITSAATGYGTSLTFTGTAGQNLALMLNGLAFSGGASGTVSLNIVRPDGTNWSQGTYCSTGNPGAACSTALTNLPLTGTYLILVNSSNPPITSGAFTLSSDKTGTLTSGVASPLTLHAGQNARLTFAGTAAVHSLTVGTSTTTPSGQSLVATVLNPSGNTVATGTYGAAGGTLSLGTLSVGTYTVLVIPNYGAATSVTLTYQ